MAVHAHPDDESSKGAATMARYVDEGVDVLVVTCTGGERGSILNPALEGRKDIEDNISEIRRAEMDRAREILGVRQHWLGFVDSGLPEGDPLPPLPEGCFALQSVDEGIRRLVREVRDFRPHVMTTYDEKGGYPHPDHIRCHEISVGAFEAAADPDRFPDEGEPWQPLKLYYDVGFSSDALRRAARGAAREGPRVAVRGAPQVARGEQGQVPRRRTSRRASRSVTGSSGATRRCSRTRPRSTRRAGSSRCRWTSSARRGRPRTSSWPGRWSTPRSPRTTCSPASASGSRHDRRDVARRASGEGWKSGPWGLAIILLLCVASYFLFKSMSKHLRKVREEFPTDDPPDDCRAAAPSAPLRTINAEL